MQITMTDTVEEARVSKTDAVQHPVHASGATIAPFSAAERGADVTCQYRLRIGETYTVADDMGAALMAGGFAVEA